MIKIAICQYQIELLTDWEAYTHKIEALAHQAKNENAQLLLLPEYAGIEIACGKFDTDQELYAALQPLIPQYIDFYKNLANAYQLYIQPGTIVEGIGPDKYVNRAYFFGPTGKYSYQDKLQLIEYEKQLEILQSGQEQKIFSTGLGVIGIAICYDSEFPEMVRRLVLAGAKLILVPSYTTSLAGFHRVFISCRARAIENQCLVALSYTVGEVSLSGSSENTFGQAAVFAPADIGFPENGILVQGNMNKVNLITADISFDNLAFTRMNGQVHNYEDAKKISHTTLHSEFI